MANNVTTRVEFQSGNDEARAYFKAIVDKIDSINADKKARKEAGEDVRIECNLYELNDDTMQMVEDKDWSALIDKIGSKWAYVEDAYDDSINTVSAWGIPEDWIMRVAEELADIDPFAIISATYDDEMPNFIGVKVYTEGDEYDSFELDSDEYDDFGLCFYWDEDEHDGEEEPDDFEATWEEAWNLLDDELKSMVSGAEEYHKEKMKEIAEEAINLQGE